MASLAHEEPYDFSVLRVPGKKSDTDIQNDETGHFSLKGTRYVLRVNFHLKIAQEDDESLS